MSSNNETMPPALLTRKEFAYLSGKLPNLSNSDKSKLNYKIRKKLEVFEKIELPLLQYAGFRSRGGIVSTENGHNDCHSSDPGSKYGLLPNEIPGPGAYILLLNELND
jgi:hypothetical protein